MKNEKISRTTELDVEVLRLYRYMLTGKYDSKKSRAMSGGILPGKNMARDNRMRPNLMDVKVGNFPGRGNNVPRDYQMGGRGGNMPDRGGNMPDRVGNMPDRGNNMHRGRPALDRDEGMERFNTRI